MRIFITGGCGYVGYSVLKLLLEKEEVEHICLYDNLSNNNLNFFFGERFQHQEKVSLIIGDILDSYSLKKSLIENNIDTVIHLAAKVSTPFADHSAHSFDQINNWGTGCLTDAIEDVDAIKKVIYLSSMSVYGNSMGNVVSESTLPAPKNFYGVAKLRGEKHIRRLFPKKEIYTIRAGNVFGYNPCIRLDSVLNKFIFEAHFNNKIEIHGSGLQNRSFVHVESLAKTILEVVTEKKDFPSLFNKLDTNLSILDIADIIQAVYPSCQRMYIEQHMEMKSIRTTSTVFNNILLKPEEIIPLIQEVSDNFTVSSKKRNYEKSLEE